MGADMRQRCEYCDNWIDDTDAVCPHCGAPNEHMMVSVSGVPKTIDELKAFAVAHNLPLEQMRFFIGEDFKEPRAFGIYQDGLDFVVYKNKADGTRAIRYRGKDEAYAVNELYQKMKSEVANQKNRLGTQKVQKAQRKTRVAGILVIIAFATALVGGIFAISRMPSRGYYSYNDTSYYYQDDYWYYYDTSSNQWQPDPSPPTTLTENNNDYWEGSSWDSSSGTSDFSSSQYYEPPSESSSSSSSDDDDWDDDDWSWSSSDSWDSSATDWSSDW